MKWKRAGCKLTRTDLRLLNEVFRPMVRSSLSPVAIARATKTLARTLGVPERFTDGSHFDVLVLRIPHFARWMRLEAAERKRRGKKPRPGWNMKKIARANYLLGIAKTELALEKCSSSV